MKLFTLPRIRKYFRIGIQAMEEMHGITTGGPYEEASEREIKCAKKALKDLNELIRINKKLNSKPSRLPILEDGGHTMRLPKIKIK